MGKIGLTRGHYKCHVMGWAIGIAIMIAVSLLGNSIIVAQDTTAETDRLIKKGEDLYKNKKYTSPAGDEGNAVAVFQKVLKIDPKNSIAIDKLAQIERFYVDKMNTATKSGDKVKAKQYAEKVLMINPAHPDALKASGAPPVAAPTPVPMAEKPTPTPEPSVSVEEKQRLERYKVYSESTVKKLEEATAAWMQRLPDNSEPIKRSMSLFEAILKSEPSNYDALWQLARAIIWYGDHSPEEQKVEIFSKGMDMAKKAIEANPNGIEGHYWLGSNMGKYGEARGIFKSLEYITPILQEMETILKIDPNHYKAITVLGILYRKAPPWPVSVGDFDKSEEFLRRAVQLNPASLHSHLELGITFNKLKKWDLAKVEFQKVIDLPFEELWGPENKEYKAEAKEILMDLKRRGV